MKINTRSELWNYRKRKNYIRVDELIKDVYYKVRWFDNPAEAYTFFRNHEWRHDHAYSRLFVDFCTRYFLEVK